MAMIDAGMTRSSTDFPGILRLLFAWLAPAASPDGETAEDCRDRRDFLADMLERNGDAFRSESDIQCMMNVYPGRF